MWTAAKDGLPHEIHRPLVVVVSRHHSDIVSKIANHYIQVKNGQVSDVRWETMRANHTWIYLDLGALFTNWAKVWGAVKDNVKRNTAVSRRLSLPILSILLIASRYYIMNERKGEVSRAHDSYTWIIL